MTARWAISDIHGCAKTFKSLVENQIGLENIQTLYLMGDYVDRGPDSKGVFDYIFHLKNTGLKVECLMGNHEDLMLNSVLSDKDYDLWMKNGGKTTLKSFGKESVNDVEEQYINFIKSTHLYLELDEYWLVHAGIETADDKPFENRRMLLWKRKMVYDKVKLRGKRVIHGHTPGPYTDTLDEIKNNEMIIGIDGGCVYSNQKGKEDARLCALNLDSLELLVQKNIDI